MLQIDSWKDELPLLGLKVLFLFCLLIIVSTTLCWGQTITYQETVLAALRHSPQLRMRAEDIRIAEAQYKSSYAGLLPSIHLSGRAERYENLDSRSASGIDTIGNEVVGGNSTAWRSSVSVNGQYYFSNWYKKRYETGYYNSMKEAGIYQCQAEGKKIIREVTELYGSMIEAQIKLHYSTRIAGCLHSLLKIKKEAYALGQYSFEDMLKAEAEAVSADRENASLHTDISELIHRMSVYTGIANADIRNFCPIEMKGELFFPDEKEAAVVAPEYKMRLREMEALQSKTIAARNALLPDVSIYGRYDLFNSSPDSLDASIRDTRPSSYSAGIVVSVPLFDGGAKYWEWRKNQHEAERLQETIRGTFEDLNREIKTLRDGYITLSKTYHHYKKINEGYERMTAIALKAHELGDRSRLDMLELEKDALIVERDLKVTQQMLAVYEKRIDLERDYSSFLKGYNGNGSCRD